MLSIPHLIVIFVVALVIFGPEKLPELARNLGKVMAEFRRATGDLQSTFESHLKDIEREADAKRIAAAHPVKDAVLPPSPSSDAPAAAPEGTKPSDAPNASAIAAGNAAALSASTTGEAVPGEPDDFGYHADLLPPAGSPEPAQAPAHTPGQPPEESPERDLDHVSDGGSGKS
jgi:sec-independent protein translocase protein TatB